MKDNFILHFSNRGKAYFVWTIYILGGRGLEKGEDGLEKREEGGAIGEVTRERRSDGWE